MVVLRLVAREEALVPGNVEVLLRHRRTLKATISE